MPEPRKTLTVIEWRQLIERSWNDEQSDLEWGHLRGQRAEFGVAARAALPALLDRAEAADRARAEVLAQVERLRALSDAATPGPWAETSSFIYEEARRSMNAAALKANSGGNFIGSTMGPQPTRYANAALIVAAVNLIRPLLSQPVASEEKR